MVLRLGVCLGEFVAPVNEIGIGVFFILKSPLNRGDISYIGWYTLVSKAPWSTDLPDILNLFLVTL